jgi:choline dehydrogenase
LPYTYLQAETFTAPNASQQAKFGMVIDESAHGSTGPVQTGMSEYIFDAVANWIPAWVSLGLPAKDLWTGSTRGASITPSIINVVNQTRSDSKAAYIDPLPPRSNLVILTGQQVTSVIFNGSTVDGNVVASGITFQSAAGGRSYSVQANKEVILSGGTVGSAQVLQLSGVGPAARLRALGINSVVDLPVGYNLQDHVSTSLYWTAP